MSPLIMMLIVIVVLALVLWAIYYLPLPPGGPAWLKNFLYVVAIVIAIIVILTKTGLTYAAG